MKKFNINTVDNVLSDQRDMKGLIDCLYDKLTYQLSLLGNYDDPGKVPHDNVVNLMIQTLHDSNEVLGLLRFILDTSINSIEQLLNAVNAYYADHKDSEKPCN